MLNAASGRTADARNAAREFERQSMTDPAWARFAARIYVALGDHNRGLDLLSRSMEAGAVPIFYKDEPLWQRVRKDPRFQAILRRMRIPE